MRFTAFTPFLLASSQAIGIPHTQVASLNQRTWNNACSDPAQPYCCDEIQVEKDGRTTYICMTLRPS